MKCPDCQGTGETKELGGKWLIDCFRCSGSGRICDNCQASESERPTSPQDLCSRCTHRIMFGEGGSPVDCLARIISIRQPWAWLIVHGHKDIENRTWSTSLRGRILIHASKGGTRSDYDACMLFMSGRGLAAPVPSYALLQRGGIVGAASIQDCVASHSSPWFTGPYGFILADATPLPFQPLKGRLGFFKRPL